MFDCIVLPNPTNGFVTIDIDGATARYTCSPGFELMGDDVRICAGNGIPTWSGVTPRCSGKSIAWK